MIDSIIKRKKKKKLLLKELIQIQDRKMDLRTKLQNNNLELKTKTLQEERNVKNS